MLRHFLIVLICFILNGCSTSLYVYLFNNTNFPIRAFGLEKDVLIAAGKNGHIMVANDFKLCINNLEYEYSSQNNLPPGKYYGAEYFPKHSVHFQVEAQGVLHLVMPDTQLPTKSVLQPKGFPVLPKETGRCDI
jgi:hypothetical protein